MKLEPKAMQFKRTREIFDLVDQGPSGRLKALEKFISKDQLGDRVYEKVSLIFRMLEDDLRQLEHYVLMDMESMPQHDFYKRKH